MKKIPILENSLLKDSRKRLSIIESRIENEVLCMQDRKKLYEKKMILNMILGNKS